jgi:hypothetical protein
MLIGVGIGIAGGALAIHTAPHMITLEVVGGLVVAGLATLSWLIQPKT